MGKLTEALHKVVQCLLRALRQRQKVVKGSRVFVSALDRINKLFAQVCPRPHGTPRETQQPIAGHRL
jgi:hypothetical protein